ncbi:MAG TPA: molybdopterin cofactor-binding domain-containing protein [Sphingomicrobium sp.]|nr:molybdopterin cofactor-binding domain-containing protein [Sphingomicrobium sp.]
MNLDRRTLLIGGGVGIGLVVGYGLWPRRLPSDLPLRAGEQAFGNFLKIARDGRITVAVPQAETGQGIWTALPQIVADELGAAWETVGVEPAPLTGDYANRIAEPWLDNLGTIRAWRLRRQGAMRITAGSTSIRAFERPLREAAAVARAMLIGAAADRWNVDDTECETAEGFVLNGVRTFSFGELAEEAALRTPPGSVAFRQGSRGRLIGQPLPRLDGPAKAEGSLQFANDVRLPGMLFASARMAPPGGRLAGFWSDAAKGIAGVRHIAARDGWFAVVADNWWAAERAVTAANPRFTAARTVADMRLLLEDALASGEAQMVFSRGDYDSTVRGSRPLAATYYAAPSQHLGLEPMSATARFGGGRLEVWAATQAPGFARAVAERAAAGAAILFYPMPVGEPAGRAVEADAIPVAVDLARRLNAPVQVVLSQGASQNQDRVALGALARMTALPGQGGITAAWQMRVATADGTGAALARLVGADSPGTLGASALDGAAPPYGIPHVRIDGITAATLPFAAGYMNGTPQRELAFFTESFIDELARAAGMEPLVFRMPMLGANGRLARCLQASARIAQWDGGGRGSAMGIAGASAFGSHIGLVATASIGEDQRVKVHRLVAAVDCGRVVNPGLAEQQIESKLIWALAQATVPAADWVAGMPRARAMGTLGLPSLGDTPEIVVRLLPSDLPPGGLSGLGTTVLAPAVANAIFAGSGKRMRSLPFDPMSVA